MSWDFHTTRGKLEFLEFALAEDDGLYDTICERIENLCVQHEIDTSGLDIRPTVQLCYDEI